jgi:hypothetical protein
MRRIRLIRGITTALALLAAGTAALPSLAHAEPIALPGQIDPLRIYGEEIRFDVLRDGEKVGQHVVRFRRVADVLQVESRSEIEVELLFLRAYDFRYQSLEHWRDGSLSALYAATNDNGDFSRVEARRDGDMLSVRGTQREWQAEPRILPTTHWNMAQLAAPQLLNTLTGNPNRVTVTDAGVETVTLGDGPRDARRFVYSGDLAVEAWYDAAGRWVKLRFPAEDGSTIEYVCRACGGPTELSARE